MKRLGIVVVAATALVTLVSPSASHAATRARTLAETVLDDSPVRLSAGPSHTCQVNDDGTVRCWGGNGSGQLGDGTTTDRRTPVPVSGLTNAVAIAAGRIHTCALLADGTARCWGFNGNGQLGDGTTTTRLGPVSVRFAALAPGAASVVAIAAGHEHTCALLADGSARCWGDNSAGQLGDGTTTNQLTPAPVSPLDNAVAIAAGVAYTCALLADGSARCWGFNNSGQLGDGTTTDRLAPVSVSGLTNAVAIAAGGAHTCALVADGSARCWGSNFFGQLGDGTTANRLTPVTVSGLTNAVAIAMGDFHTCALLADGSARCWGDNSAGQLGDGSTTQRPVPTAVTITFFQRTPGGGVFMVAPLVNVVKIAAGVSHTCAILANGSVRCWGENGFGQLGIGTTADVLRPVSVPSFTLNIDPLVHVRGNTGVATVQIIATCDAGQELHVDVTLTQGAVSGHGVGVGECTGGIERYPVTVPAQGLLEGPADVAAAARILDGGVVVDSQEWTRRVQIQVPIVSAGATLEGRATGVGNGKDTASLRLRGQFTAGNGVLLEQATLTLRALLDEAGGAGELTRGGGGAALLPLTLTARAGGTPTEAIYQTASGVRPVVRAEVKQGDPEAGRMEFSIKVDRGTIPIGPALCAPGSATDGQPLTTHLTTSFVIDDGVNPPLEIAMEEAWRCLDLIRGTNHPQSLRTP